MAATPIAVDGTTTKITLPLNTAGKQLIPMKGADFEDKVILFHWPVASEDVANVVYVLMGAEDAADDSSALLAVPLRPDSEWKAVWPITSDANLVVYGSSDFDILTTVL